MLAIEETSFDRERLTKRQPEKDGAGFFSSTPAAQSIGKVVTKSLGMRVVLCVLATGLCPS
jgi:hypothetical protein